MRIHSDILTRADFREAASHAWVNLVDLDEKGSKSRAKAWNFTLSGSGARRSQWATSDHKAATWDEWGIFLAHLFDVDPQAHIAGGIYESREHFHWATDYRFRNLTPAYQHLRHKWDSHGHGDSFYEHHCDCGATQRNMMQGRTFNELMGYPAS